MLRMTGTRTYAGCSKPCEDGINFILPCSCLGLVHWLCIQGTGLLVVSVFRLLSLDLTPSGTLLQRKYGAHGSSKGSVNTVSVWGKAKPQTSNGGVSK